MNIYELSGEPFIYLFRLYSKNNTNVIHFCGHSGVVYQGVSYEAIPCEITGYNVSIGGVVQPTLTIFSKQVASLIRQYDHFLGWEVGVMQIKKAQLSLDNLLTRRPFDTFTITQKTSEVPGKIASFKLKPRNNLKGQVGRFLNATCSWVYRGDGCEYQGAAFTVNNQRTQNPDLDICALSLTAAKIRNNLENFGGIPTINDFND